MSSNKGKNTEGKHSGSTVEGQNQNSSGAILRRLENLVSSNVSRLNQIISQNVEMKTSVASIDTEITKLKSSLQFMNDTVNKLKKDMNQHVEMGVYEAFKQEVMDELDDMENRDKRNNIVFWNIPEKSEAAIG